MHISDRFEETFVPSTLRRINVFRRESKELPSLQRRRAEKGKPLIYCNVHANTWRYIAEISMCELFCSWKWFNFVFYISKKRRNFKVQTSFARFSCIKWEYDGPFLLCRDDLDVRRGTTAPCWVRLRCTALHSSALVARWLRPCSRRTHEPWIELAFARAASSFYFFFNFNFVAFICILILRAEQIQICYLDKLTRGEVTKKT